MNSMPIRNQTIRLSELSEVPMKRYGIDVTKIGSYYGGYSWSRGKIYQATTPGGGTYEFFSGYSADGYLYGYQLRISEVEHDTIEFKTFNEVLNGINTLEETGKVNLMKIVSEAFELNEELNGLESGGIGPQRNLLGITRTPLGDVAVQWKYSAEAGLSDRTYHAETGIHVDYYDLNNGILIKTPKGKQPFKEGKPVWSGEVWTKESKHSISSFLKKWELKNAV